jgi:hypothetical protein
LLDERSAERIKLKFVFASATPAAREPLITRGVTGAADILLVEYIDRNTIRFSLDHWGIGLVSTDPITIDPQSVQEIIAHFNEPTDEAMSRNEPGEFVLKLNGKEIWRVRSPLYRTAAERVAIAESRIGASTCAESFSGAILSVSYPGPNP